MYVCIYVFMYVFMYVCMYVCMLFMYACMHVLMKLCMCTIKYNSCSSRQSDFVQSDSLTRQVSRERMRAAAPSCTIRMASLQKATVLCDYYTCDTAIPTNPKNPNNPNYPKIPNSPNNPYYLSQACTCPHVPRFLAPITLKP